MAASRTRHPVLVTAVAVLAAVAACSPTEPSTEGASALAYDGGEITEAQYVAIVAASRQCMVEKGYDVGPLEMRDDNLTYGFTISGGEVGSTSTSHALADCEQPLNYAAAEIAYQEQNILTAAEREQVLGELMACLEEAGVSGASAGDSLPDLTQRVVEIEAAGGDAEPGFTCLSEYSSRIFGPGT